MAELHTEMRDLSEQIATLKPRLAKASGELAELNSVMQPFMALFRQEVLRFHDALLAMQREISDLKAMQGSVSDRDAGQVASPLGQFTGSVLSVQEQYDRTWGGKEVPEFEGPNLPPASDKLKAFYADVLVAVHPDLQTKGKDRKKYEELLQKANAAYVKRDVITLDSMATMYRERSNLPALVTQEVVDQLQDLVDAMEELSGQIEGEIFELQYSEITRIKAYVDDAKSKGHDLVKELSEKVRQALQAANEELAALKKNR